VTLYEAYAEGEVDELLSVLPGPQPFDDAKRQWQVGRKLNYARSLIRKLKTSDLSGLLATLEDAKVLFKQRNELVHGRLFAGGRLVSSRTRVPTKHVSPDEITRLAEQIFSWKEQIWMHRCRLLPLLSELNGSNVA